MTKYMGRCTSVHFLHSVSLQSFQSTSDILKHEVAKTLTVLVSDVILGDSILENQKPTNLLLGEGGKCSHKKAKYFIDVNTTR